MATKNRFGVLPRVWKMWTAEGRSIFANNTIGRFVPVWRWNAAFVAACEASGLNVEYEARCD